MVNSRPKNTLCNFYGIHGMSYRGCIEEKEQKNTSCASGVRLLVIMIATGANLLDTECKSYGLNDDLIDTINY